MRTEHSTDCNQPVTHAIEQINWNLKRAMHHADGAWRYINALSEEGRELPQEDRARIAGVIGEMRGELDALSDWVMLAVTRCIVCGDPIEGERSTRRYCSDRCRQRAHRRREQEPS